MKTMIAKYNGVCSGCGGYISVGKLIKYHKLHGAYHYDCVPGNKKPTYTKKEFEHVTKLINDAAEAEELIDIDELEQFTEENKHG